MNETELNEKFLEYETLKIEAKAIEEKLDVLKEEIKDHVKMDEKINCKFGVIQMKTRDRWTFTEPTQKMAKELKTIQDAEIKKGEATNNPIFFMEYRQKEHVEE